MWSSQGHFCLLIEMCSWWIVRDCCISRHSLLWTYFDVYNLIQLWYQFWSATVPKLQHRCSFVRCIDPRRPKTMVSEDGRYHKNQIWLSRNCICKMFNLCWGSFRNNAVFSIIHFILKIKKWHEQNHMLLSERFLFYLHSFENNTPIETSLNSCS